ncbi:hypothetical protein I4U23_004087 [Adineta vaga]|nr:hypothetical protein I4U23_004087 [Adineta vaga]
MVEHIDRARLDTDLRYRFDYLSKFINFTSNDITALNTFAKIANPFIQSVAEIIYDKLLHFDITKNHFLRTTHDFQGTMTTDENQLTLQSEQILFRIHSIRKYLCRILRQSTWNDAFLEYISNVGKIHTNSAGTHSIDVDYIHMNALFGYLEHVFIDGVLNNDEIDGTLKKDIIIALNKVFWIQNDFFSMHYIGGSKKGADNKKTNHGESVCRAIIVISYSAQLMNVRFTKHLALKNTNLPNNNYQFSNTITTDEHGQYGHVSALEYACSDYDRCEQQFVLDYVDWLITINRSEFWQNTTPLLIGQNQSPGECFFGYNVSKSCPANTNCVAQWTLLSEQVKVDCSDYKNTFSTIVRVNMVDYTAQYGNTLLCNYHMCNHPNVLFQLESHLHQYYNLKFFKILSNISKSVGTTQITSIFPELNYSKDLQQTTITKSSSSTISSSKTSSKTTTPISSSATSPSVTSASSVAINSSNTHPPVSRGCSYQSKQTTAFIAYGIMIFVAANYRFDFN